MFKVGCSSLAPMGGKILLFFSLKNKRLEGQRESCYCISKLFAANKKSTNLSIDAFKYD